MLNALRLNGKTLVVEADNYTIRIAGRDVKNTSAQVSTALSCLLYTSRLPMKFFATRKTGEITTRYSDASTIKSVFTSIALSVVMDIVMACATGVILFRMNATLFSISIFTTLLSILLVFIFKQPFKRINRCV